ncbi:MAG: tRNA (N6-threonylcarbamoyladenosine(37)-N6)-methyltransferase TrmO [Candidatus Lokiarchaeota archaeon]|nr:tRNA (N6-threonylcarbamoyladenosine(37)-N6)-methyltransferase TrmO [Candidatus Lokiarchaeota archaeon]MBD3338668.1 tRNA (N6-threonylcarbamoyladenosine(37)-N6)-methyltransferase TrmO [Candidatus Lokiarchaeota archaeon]
MKEFRIKPIGIVKNKADKEVLKYANEDIKLDFEVAQSRGADLITSEIIVEDKYADCLDGIEDFSHLVILFWTHKTPNSARRIKKVHPAGLKNMPIKGIFATRSPVRPNPIAKTTVKLIKRKGKSLLVEGLDAIDNTPVVDIKPHLPFYDSPLNVKLADWMYSLMEELKNLIETSDNNSQPNPYSVNPRSHPCLNRDKEK